MTKRKNSTSSQGENSVTPEDIVLESPGSESGLSISSSSSFPSRSSTPTSFDQYLSGEEIQERVKDNLRGSLNERLTRMWNNFPTRLQCDTSEVRSVIEGFTEVLPQVKKNLDSFSNDDTYVGEHIQDYIKALEGEFLAWQDFALLVAVNDLFTDEGKIREEILANIPDPQVKAVLTGTPVDGIQENRAKQLLLNDYLVNIIGFPYPAEFITSQELEEFSKINSVLSATQMHLSDITVDADTKTTLQKRLAGRIDYPCFKAPRLKLAAQSILPSSEQTLEDEFRSAESNLLEVLGGENNEYTSCDPALVAHGKQVLAEVRKLKANNNPDVAELTNVLKMTTNIVDFPNSAHSKRTGNSYLTMLQDYNQYGTKFAKEPKYSWGKVLGGLMLALASVALIAMASVSLVVTLGISAPASGAMYAVGAASALAAIGLFKSAKKMTGLGVEMENLGKEVERKIK